MMVVNKGSHTSFMNTHVRNPYFLLIFSDIYHQVVFRTTLNKACALFVSIVACSLWIKHHLILDSSYYS
jgi:hypothetical protein